MGQVQNEICWGVILDDGFDSASKEYAPKAIESNRPLSGKGSVFDGDPNCGISAPQGKIQTTLEYIRAAGLNRSGSGWPSRAVGGTEVGIYSLNHLDLVYRDYQAVLDNHVIRVFGGR